MEYSSDWKAAACCGGLLCSGTVRNLNSVDLGEDRNLISALTTVAVIHDELISLTGRDLLGLLDQLRTNTITVLFIRQPDNDADGRPNEFESTYGLDRDSPKDASGSLAGEPTLNYDEYVAGTAPDNSDDYFRVFDLKQPALI